MKDLGYGQGYRYAHDQPDALVPGQRHFPDAMTPRNYYDPVARGLELKLREALERIRGGGREIPEPTTNRKVDERA